MHSTLPWRKRHSVCGVTVGLRCYLGLQHQQLVHQEVLLAYPLSHWPLLRGSTSLGLSFNSGETGLALHACAVNLSFWTEDRSHTHTVYRPPRKKSLTWPTFWNLRSLARMFPTWFIVAPQENLSLRWSKISTVLELPCSAKYSATACLNLFVRLKQSPQRLMLPLLWGGESSNLAYYFCWIHQYLY